MNSFNKYLKWASDSLDVYYNNSIDIRDYDVNNNIERGIVNYQDVISKDTILFSIPFSKLLTIESIIQDDNHILSSLLSILQEDDILSLLLIYEKLKGSESLWSMHIDILPSKYDSIPNYTDEELDELKGTNIYTIGKHWKEQIKDDYNKLMDTNINNDIKVKDIFIHHFNNNTYTISYDMYLWALSTIWSRFISVSINKCNDSKKIVRRAMVPLIDLLNHDPNSTTSHILTESNDFIIISSNDTMLGEIYLNYGLCNNSRLLQLYGFTIVNNPYESVDIFINMTINKTKEVEKVLNILNITYNEPYKLTTASLNQKLLASLRLLYCPSNILKNDMKLLKFLRTSNDDVEEKVISTLRKTLHTMLSEYPHSIDDDELILNDKRVSENNRYFNAVNLRYSEKLILRRNLSLLDEYESQVFLKMNGRIPENCQDSVIIGCSSLAGLYQPIGEENSLKLVHTALHNGFIYYDTAPHYGLGLSEERLGRAIDWVINNNVKIYTKVGRLITNETEIMKIPPVQIEYENMACNSNCIFPETSSDRIPVKNYTYEGIMKSYEDSIKRLGLIEGKIFGLRIHDCEDENSIHDVLNGGLSALLELKSKGKIQEVSFGLNNSKCAIRILKEAKRRSLKVDSIMIAGSFNLIDHDIDSLQLFYFCKHEGIEVVNAGIYASGLLAGSEYYKYSIASHELHERVKQWQSLCDEYNVSIKQVALAFAFLPENITKVAIGVKSSEEVIELVENYHQAKKIRHDIFADAKKRGLISNHILF